MCAFKNPAGLNQGSQGRACHSHNETMEKALSLDFAYCLSRGWGGRTFFFNETSGCSASVLSMLARSNSPGFQVKDSAIISHLRTFGWRCQGLNWDLLHLKHLSLLLNYNPSSSSTEVLQSAPMNFRTKILSRR